MNQGHPRVKNRKNFVEEARSEVGDQYNSPLRQKLKNSRAALRMKECNCKTYEVTFEHLLILDHQQNFQFREIIYQLVDNEILFQ